MKLDGDKLDGKSIPILPTADPDVLRASEAFGASGGRQLRCITINDSPEHEGMAYVDIRDVSWLVNEYNAALARQTAIIHKLLFQRFWEQVVAFVLIDSPNQIAL